MAGGTSGRRADRLPDVGEQRLGEPAEGGDGARGRLRPGRRDGEGEAQAPATASSRSRRSTTRRRVGRDRRRHDRRVPRQPGDRVVREVPRARRPRPRPGQRRAASRRATRTCRPASTRTRRRARPPSAIAKAKYVAFDMSDQQPASFGATVGQGEWGSVPGLPAQPEGREGHPGRSSSRRPPPPTRAGSSRLSAGNITVEPSRRGGSTAGSWAGSQPVPDRHVLPAARVRHARRLDGLSDRLHDRPQLLRAERLQTSSSGSTTTRRCSRRRR